MTRFISLAVCMIVLLGVSGTSLATVFSYNATLNGANEFAPNASLGTGFVQVDYDDIAKTLHVQASFSGLTGTTTSSHIHSATFVPGTGTAGIATTIPTFIGFPLGVTSGTYDNTLDLTLLSSWNSPYINSNGGLISTAEAALASSMAAGTAYFNVYTSAFIGGEIRGFLAPVPEPATLVLLGLGGLLIRRKNKGVRSHLM